MSQCCTILIIIMTCCTVALADYNQIDPAGSSAEVYGVRWFLGEHFEFTSSSNDKNEYYVVMFNSDTPLEGDLLLVINRTRFTCSSTFLSTKALEDHHHDIYNNTG